MPCPLSLLCFLRVNLLVAVHDRMLHEKRIFSKAASAYRADFSLR